MTYDPFQFGMPPEDAFDDPEALLGLGSGAPGYVPQEDGEFLEDQPDIPRVEDANPRKDPSGAQKLTEGFDPTVQAPQDGGFGAEQDPEALQQAILDAQMEENANSEAFQTEAFEQNEQDERERAKHEGGF